MPPGSADVTFDVVVVGASVGGSTTAALLARQGLRVALVEKSPDPSHFKSLCTHELIALSDEPLRRLGIAEQIDAVGGPERELALWTRFGWVLDPEGGPTPTGRSRNVRRETLDPVVRGAALEEDGVEPFLGATATALVRGAGGRPAGVVVRGRDGAERTLRARVVVGADGRSSGVARMAGVPARIKSHGRFAYAAYYEGLPPVEGLGTGGRAVAQFWLQDPDIAYRFPTDGGLDLVAVAIKRTPDRLAAFKLDREGEFERAFLGLDHGPDFSRARRVGKMKGALQVENQVRAAAAPGVAFVGDAAQVSDYVWGTGCGFAMASGMWLADLVGPALADGGTAEQVDRALARYRRHHRATLAPHHLLTTGYASGRGFDPVETALYRAAPHDPRVARAVHRLGGRTATPQRILTPGVLGRAALGAVRAEDRRARRSGDDRAVVAR